MESNRYTRSGVVAVPP
jgi:hypothetical protein